MARHGELDSSAGRRFYSDVAIFGALAAFLVLGGVVYGVFSGEASGTILLVLTGVFAAIVAGYLGLQDRLERSAARTQAQESEPVDDDQFLIWIVLSQEQPERLRNKGTPVCGRHDARDERRVPADIFVHPLVAATCWAPKRPALPPHLFTPRAGKPWKA